MAQVLTNNTGLAYARESSLGVLPGSPVWRGAEPNSQGTFGATITTVARNPISKLRQKRKGTVVDLDAGNEFDADQTIDTLLNFTEAFLFATAVNFDLTFVGADTTASGFTVPSLTAAQAAKLLFTASGPTSLLYAQGYALDANNTDSTVVAVTVDPVTTDVLIEVAGNAIETAPNNAEVSIAGVRAAEIGDLDVTVSAGVATITSNNGTAATNPVDFTVLGLTLGQRVHFGGLTTANRPASFGSGRITSIAAQTLVLDKIDATLVTSDGTDTGSGGTEIATDLLFGRFVRNVQSDASDFNRISHTFEQAMPNLFETDPPTPVAEPDGFEYVLGAVANQMTWNMPLTEKSTATFSFIGTTAEEAVDGGSRKTNAATALLPLFTGAMNTSADFFRLGIFDVDETGLTSDFKDLTVTINNNVAPEKVLATVGARFINNGNFEVTVEGSALFTNRLVALRVRNNTTVTMDWLLQNDDGAIAVDIPSAVLSSGGKEFPVDATVTIALTLEAFVDPILNTSIGVSFFPIFPTS